MNFKIESGYFGNISLPEGFVRTEMSSLNESELKVYLAVLTFAQNESKQDLNIISDIAGIDINKTIEALTSLEKKALIKLTSSSVTIKAISTENGAKPVAHKEYSATEIDSLHDEDIKKLTLCAEKTYGKLLNYAELNMLASLYDAVGLPCEVLMILIEYTGALGKKTMRYLQTAASDWKAAEIDTPKKAHQHITYLEQQKEYYSQMKDILGIYGREFTKREREYLDKWKKEGYSPDKIKESYEKTVDATGKIAFGYMDKVIASSDILPDKQVVVTSKPKPKKRVKPTGFNNFTSRERDYDAIKARAKEKAMQKAKKLEG